MEVCRLCTQIGANVNVFKVKVDEISLCAKIMYLCVNINIEENDYLPSFVCNACEKELAACYAFVLRCEESDKKLRAQALSTYSECSKDTIKLEACEDIDENDQFSNTYTEDLRLDVQVKEENTINERESKKRKKRTKLKNLNPICSVCGRKCTSLSALVIHMRIHTNEKPFHCRFCEKKYKDKGTLKRHTERNHQTKRERLFICENCGKGFFSKNDVKVHMRVHTGETPYTCNLCSASFSQSSSLLRHKLRHTGEKRHNCLTCTKAFRTKQELLMHSSVHNNERKFSCSICNVQFKQKTYLNKHIIKIHQQPNRFICNHCGRTFNVKVNLKSHISRKHSESAGFCPTCQKSVSNIETHMWRHTGKKPFKCEFCSSSFSELRSLAHHVNFKHTKTDKFKCTAEGCIMSFPSRPMLDFHTAKVHATGIPFPCDRCSRGFYRKNDLARHKIGTHKEKLL